MLGFRLNKLGAAIRNFRVSDLFTGSTEGGYYDLNDINASPDGYHSTDGKYALLNDGRGLVNLLTYSQELRQWGQGDGSTASNTTVAPDGTTTMDTYTIGTSGTVPSSPGTVSLSAATQYTFSYYFNPAQTAAYHRVRISTAASSLSAFFNPSTLAFETVGAGFSGGTCEAAANGNYRVSIQYTPASGDEGSRTLSFAGVVADNSGTADTGETLILWGMMANQGTLADYQYTNDTVQGPGQSIGLELPGNRDGRGIVNLLPLSEEFENSGWTKGNATYNPANNLLLEAATTATHFLLENFLQKDADTFTGFVVVAKQSRRYLDLGFSGASNWSNTVQVKYDLDTNLIVNQGTGTSATGVVDLGDGTLLFYLTGTSINTTASGFTIAFNDDGTNRFPSYAGDATKGGYLYKAFVKRGTFGSFADYQKTGPYLGGPGEIWGQATSPARPTLAEIPRGERRNRGTYSEDFTNAAWTATAMGGTATTLVETASTNFHRKVQTFATSVPANQRVTLSVSASALGAGDVRYLGLSLNDSATTSNWAAIRINVATDATESSNATAGWTIHESGYDSARDRYFITASSTSSFSINGFISTALSTNVYTAAGRGTESYAGDGVSGLRCSEVQFEYGDITDYQKVTAVYQVTESGVPSILTKYLDGGDYQSLGRQYLTPRQDGRGIITALLHTERFHASVWSGTGRDSTAILSNILTETTANSQHNIVQSYSTAGQRCCTVRLSVNSGTRRFRLVNYNATDGQVEGIFNLQTGTVQSGATASIEDMGGGIYECSVYATTTVASGWYLTICQADGTFTYVGDGTSGFNLIRAWDNAGSTKVTYQANSYTLGGSLGTCGFFCEPTQTFAVGGVFSTFNLAVAQTLFAKCGATVGNRSLQVFTNQTTGYFGVYARGTYTGQSTNLADGLWHSWLLVWDGTTLMLYIDNYAGEAVGVGTSVEEQQNILSFVRTESSPAAYYTGMGDILLMRDTYMNAAEIAQWRNTINTEYGVA